MKLLLPNQICPRRTGAYAFTFAEMCIALGIFSMVTAAMVAVQIFGLRIYTLAATKQEATEECRETMNAIRDLIRQANFIDVGICTSGPSSFNSLATNTYQIGNAVMIYPAVPTTNIFISTYNPNIYSLFYLDTVTQTNDWQMTQVTIASNAANTALVTNTTAWAGYITNQDNFADSYYDGTLMTNELVWTRRHNVYVKLQFYQWEYPIATVGTNGGANMYDSYQLRTRVTQRAF